MLGYWPRLTDALLEALGVSVRSRGGRGVGGGGVTLSRRICRSGQPKNTPICWEIVFEHGLPAQDRFWCFSLRLSSFVADAAHRVWPFWLGPSRAKKHANFASVCFPVAASPDLGAKGVPEMLGMMRLCFWILRGSRGCWGCRRRRYSHCLGVVGSTFCHRAACGDLRWLILLSKIYSDV